MVRNSEPHAYYPDHELPHITTLLPDQPPTPGPMSAPNNSLSLAPLRSTNDPPSTLRKRSATVPGKTPRGPGSSGPKVVACNFCRGVFRTSIFHCPH
jgi:hypothetical protein